MQREREGAGSAAAGEGAGAGGAAPAKPDGGGQAEVEVAAGGGQLGQLPPPPPAAAGETPGAAPDEPVPDDPVASPATRFEGLLQDAVQRVLGEMGGARGALGRFGGRMER